MRIFVASFATETNTFSPVPTDRSCFDSAFYAAPGDHPVTPTLCSAVFPVLRARADANDITVIEGTATWAEPGGLVQRETYENLRDEILMQLRAALPLDAVVVGLHGAMVAQGCEDCEGDFLSRIREIVGPDVIVGATFDPHSHLTPLRVESVDILNAFLEFPHTDFLERAEQVVDLVIRTVRAEIKPVISTFDCRMIDVLPTSQEPMRSYVDRIKALEGQGSILSVSVIHGFLAGNVAELGARIIVVTDDNVVFGDETARLLGMELFSFRGRTRMKQHSVLAAIDETRQSLDVGTDTPVILADIWDNPGGGVAGDGTILLRAMVEAGLRSIGVATIWDPIAVSFCRAAGVGAQLKLRIGGKAGAGAGEPLDLDVEVLKVVDAAWQSFGASRVPLGASAVVRVRGTEIDIILNTNRTQTFDPDIFTNLGVDFSKKSCLLVKSTNHFYSAFRKISSHIIYVDAGTHYPSDPQTTNYTRLEREIWPRVENPF